MVTSSLYIALMVGSVFLLPLEYMPVTWLYLTCVFFLYSLYRKRDVFLYVVFMPINVFISIAYYILQWDGFLPYMGSLVYGSLCLVALGNTLAGRNFYQKAQEKSPLGNVLHFRLSSLVVVVMNLMAFVLSIVLLPSVLYILLPLFLSIASMIAAKPMGGLLVSFVKTGTTTQVEKAMIRKMCCGKKENTETKGDDMKPQNFTTEQALKSKPTTDRKV